MANEAQEFLIPCGIDEVGRGPVWGPLVVCGVANPNHWFHPGVKDSKKYTSHQQRVTVANEVIKYCLFHVTSATAEEINEFGIATCLRQAFRRTINRLMHGMVPFIPANTQRIHFRFVVDGNDMPDTDQTVTHPFATRLSVRAEPKADVNVFEVSAASVVAKAYRDSYVLAAAAQRPELVTYQIDRNMGYGTRPHALAIREKGMLPDHRIQFAQKLVTTLNAKEGNVEPESLSVE